MIGENGARRHIPTAGPGGDPGPAWRGPTRKQKMKLFFRLGQTELWHTRSPGGLPPGFAYLVDASGAYLTDAAGAYLYGRIQNA